MRRLLISLFLASLVTLVTSIVPVSAATSNARFVGTVSSLSFVEALGGRDNASHFVEAMADAVGVPPGDLYSDFAANHAGSVAACFAATPAPKTFLIERGHLGPRP